MSYAAFLKERVLTPCGMTDTGFDVPLEKRHRYGNAYLLRHFIPK